MKVDEDKKWTKGVKKIYVYLETLGYSEKYIRDAVLPNWWDNEENLSQCEFNYFVFRITSVLGIPVDKKFKVRRKSIRKPKNERIISE